jgi:polyhydroxyalkanoate synthase
MFDSKDQQKFFAAWFSLMEALQKRHEDLHSSHFEAMQELMPISPLAMGEAWNKAVFAFMKHPAYLFEVQKELMVNLSKQEEDTSLDKRFSHEAWMRDPYFSALKKSYLLNSNWLRNTISNLEGIDDKTKQKLEFYVNQYIDAICPTNYPLTNPEVLEEFTKTGGASLEKGMEKLMDDLAKGHWIDMTDPKAFVLGKSLATSKGEVIYRNDIIELIHYKPLTEKQHSVPLLIIPPWINKFYIFDLSPHNSFVKWMLEQGMDVFMISWVNPGTNLSSKSFEDYMFEGGYKAAEVVSEFTGSNKLNTLGYCIGGNLLVALTAYLAKAPAPFEIVSQTLIATIIDFEKIGDLKFFLEDENLEYIEHNLERNGFVDPERLKSIFSMLRPKDLLWSFFIKNYLLGQTPPAFDFLYWNSDGTRVPEVLHKDVLRYFFKANLLMVPGGLKIRNVPIDLRSIEIPTFFLSTMEDHIAPWKSTYPAVHLLECPTEFVLGGAGHVVGVMNPPEKHKYAFYTNIQFPYTADEWFEKSTKHEGSWWPYWYTWLKPISGKKVSPVATSDVSYGEAPGEYVREL